MDFNQEHTRGHRSRRAAPPPIGTGLGGGLRRVATRFMDTLRGPTAAPSTSSRVRGLQISPPLETLRGRPAPLVDITRTDDVDIGEQLWASSASDHATAAARARAHAQLIAGTSGANASTSARQPPQHLGYDVSYEIDAWPPTSASTLPMPTFDLLTTPEYNDAESPRPLNVLLIGENREADIDVDLLGPTSNPSLGVATGPWRRHSFGSIPSPTTSLAESYSYTVDSLSVDGAGGSSRSMSGMSGSTGNGSNSSSSKSSRATSFRTRSTPSALSLVGPWRANLLNETASRSSNGLRLYDLDEEEAGDDDAGSGRPLLSATGPASPTPGPRIVGGHSFSATARFANRPHAETASHQDQIGTEQWSAPVSAGGASGLRRAATSARRRLVIANAAPTDRFSTSTQGSIPVLPQQQQQQQTNPSDPSGSSLRRTATVAGAANLHHVPAVPDRRGPASVPRRVLFVANSGPSDRGRRGGGNGSSSGSSSGRSRRSTWSSASSGAAR